MDDFKLNNFDRMLIAVNFHYIREKFNEPYPSIFGVTPRQFSDTLDELGRFLQFLSIQDLKNIIDGKQKMPEKSAVITFDDGFREQYEIAWPILKKKGIPAIFFVNTKPIDEKIITNTHKIHIIRAHTPPERFQKVLSNILREKNIKMHFPDIDVAKKVYKYDEPQIARLKYFLNYSLDYLQRNVVINESFSQLDFHETQISTDLYMTKEMTKDLAEQGMLGTHGHTHRPLGLIPDEEAITDFKDSLNRLNRWTGQKIEALSYPFGFKEACSTAVASFACMKKVKIAFTMERAGNPNLKTPLFLGRFSNSDLPEDCNQDSLEQFWNSITYAQWYR